MRIFLFGLLYLFATVSFARDDLPKNIRYTEASEVLNWTVKQIITNAYTSKKYEKIFGSKIICGPSLWHRIKKQPILNDVKLTETNFFVPITAGPNNGKVQELKGALFQTESEIKLFSDILRGLPQGSLNIRKIDSQEARIYWALIPYDIEEPIYTVEYGDLRFLLDVNKADKKVFWIDEFSGYRTK